MVEDASGGVRRATIKIFGERNTSTNALKLLVEQNCGSRVLPSTMIEIDPVAARRVARLQRWRCPARLTERRIDDVFERAQARFAWKHAATRFERADTFDDVLVIVCVRNPASWLLALHKRPYHLLGRLPDRFEDFLEMDWQTVRRERMERRRLTPMALYNEKLRAHHTFLETARARGNSVAIVPFESFATDQAACFDRLRPMVENPVPSFIALDRSTKDPSKDRDYYRRYYGEERWRDELPPEALGLVEAGIDWEMAGKFGYESL